MSNRLTALVAGAAGVLTGIGAALGVLGRGDGTWATVTTARGETIDVAASGVYVHSARQLVAEGIGWDLLTLAVVVPLLLLSAAFVARGSFRGLLVAGGLLGYVTYLALEYSVTWSFGPMFPLWVTTLAVAIIGLAAVARGVTAAGVTGRFDASFPVRSWVSLSVTMAALLVVMWASRIAAALRVDVPELFGETTMTVQALDLGLVVPVTLVVAALTLRREPIGLVLAAAFAVTFTTMTAAIASMLVSAWIVTGVLAVPPLVTFAVATTAGLGIGWRMNSSFSRHRTVATQGSPLGSSDGFTRSAAPARGGA